MAFQIKADDTNCLVYQDGTLHKTFVIADTRYSRSGSTLTLDDGVQTFECDAEQLASVESTNDRFFAFDSKLYQMFNQQVHSVDAGTGIVVDNSDPSNPIVSLD